MKTFKIEITREAQYWESAIVEIEAKSLEEAKEIAIEEAELGNIDPEEFSHDDDPVINYEVFDASE